MILAKRMTLAEIALSITRAPRAGAEKDEPEGTRYIQVSDTLAKVFVESIIEHMQEDTNNDILISGSQEIVMGEDA